MKDINKTITIIGVAFIILAGVTYIYQESETDRYLGGLIEDTEVNYPLRGYTFPILIGGVVLLIIGLSINSMKGGKN